MRCNRQLDIWTDIIYFVPCWSTLPEVLEVCLVYVSVGHLCNIYLLVTGYRCENSCTCSGQQGGDNYTNRGCYCCLLCCMHVAYFALWLCFVYTQVHEWTNTPWCRLFCCVLDCYVKWPHWAAELDLTDWHSTALSVAIKWISMARSTSVTSFVVLTFGDRVNLVTNRYTFDMPRIQEAQMF